jgi:hypothetical protein
VVDLDIDLNIFLTLHEIKGDKTFLVEELDGTAHTVTPFFHLYYDDTPRPTGLISAPWSQLQGHFDTFFKQVPNPEADKNETVVEQDLGEFFSDRQHAAYQSAINSTQSESSQLADLKTELLALSEVGLNVNHAAVQNWIKVINDKEGLPSGSDIVGKVILEGKSIGDVANELAASIASLKTQLGILATYNDLTPPDDAILARLNDLRKLVVLRTVVARR